MLADPLLLILLGIGLILVVAIWVRPKVRIGSFRGNIIGGNVRGTATQTYAPRELAKPEQDGDIATRDVIGWLICPARRGDCRARALSQALRGLTRCSAFSAGAPSMPIGWWATRCSVMFRAP